MTLVIGHRGASADRPENTLDAFVEAAAQGADGVELDVRRTRDGVLVVHHDPVIAGVGTIADLDRSELPPSVPDLADALRVSAPLLVNVEIKNSPDEPGFDPDRRIADEVLERTAVVVAGLERPPAILVSSFDLDTIDRVRELDPLVETGYLVLSLDQPLDAVAVCVERGHRAVHPYDLFVDAAQVARCVEAGVALNVWTVDDPARIAQLSRWGVDAIITNTPAAARAALVVP